MTMELDPHGTRARVLGHLEAWTTLRRNIHQEPELAYEEHDTAAKVARELEALGIEVHRGLGGTGLVGVIRGTGGEGPMVGLRADMDALPIQEGSTFAHASKKQGCMHACGHDGHTTMLLAAAHDLMAERDFRGSVALIFQPAEEGGGGAKRMIDDGLFERFPIESVYALHNWPSLPLGQVAVHRTSAMAATDRIEIRIEGRGGHAAMPHLTRDPVVIAAQIITALQQIASRFADPTDAVVVSITSVITSQTTAFNVIPSHVDLLGTVRTLKEETRTNVERELHDICTHVAKGLGGRADIRYIRGYPSTVNTEAESALAARAATRIFGEHAVHQNLAPSMGGEDFAYMLLEKPGAYVWLGQGDASHVAALHHPRYDFNDAAIPLGAAWFVAIAREVLGAG